MNNRKANLKKLRIPTTKETIGPRNGRQKATTTISKFFAPECDDVLEEPEEKEKMDCSESMPSPIADCSPLMPSPIDKLEEEPHEKLRRSTRTKLKTFIPKNQRMKPEGDNPLSDSLTKRQSNDFATPAKNIKSAPKSKAKTKARPKKQQKIKSAFFKNEELFSEIQAQHCLADNINPDEMQVALALSRSEAELSGCAIEKKCTNEYEGIRDKLKQFGFQVAESEDYNFTLEYKITKGKNKWANKFKPLTLRNPSRQLQKVNQKIEELLKREFRPYESTHAEEERRPYSVHNSNLLPFVAENPIIHSDSSTRMEIVDYYVLSLFEPSKTKAGHLLKDIRRVPGRDISPVKTKSASNEICVGIEMDSQFQSPAMKRSRVAESNFHIESLSCPSIERDTCATETLEFSIRSSLPATKSILQISQTNDRQTESVAEVECDAINCSVKSNASNGNDKEAIQCEPEDILKNSDLKTTSVAESNTNENEVSSQMHLQFVRATSPDIFADSDVEMETDDGSEMEKLKFTSSEDIETYEIFSSNEAKISLGPSVDTGDLNQNSSIAVVDLTQCDSETCSHNSKQCIPSSGPIEPYQELNRLPPSPLVSKLEHNLLTKSNTFKEKEFSFNSNESSCLGIPNDTKSKKSFSFGSSASDEFSKSAWFNKSNIEGNSMDLTQNDDEDCIVLSDDEVNYSIWKADNDKSFHVKDEKTSSNDSPDSNSKENHDFSFVDFVAATQPLAATQSEEFDSSFTRNTSASVVSSLEMDLSKRSEFGILEEQSPFKTPTKTLKKTPRKTPTKSPKNTFTATKCRRTLSESFLGSPIESSIPVKRFSSSNKFKEFTKSEEDSFSDLDDIDKLIYGSPSRKIYKKPTGLTQLLTGAINQRVVTPEKSYDEVPQEFEFNNRIYLVRSVDVSNRPNFAAMEESALLDKLYRYGIKPLKRKQAEKILEYIYNQTHPCLVDEADLSAECEAEKSTSSRNLDENDSENYEDVAVNESKFNFKDCWGHVLLSDNVPSLEIKNEQYIVQTNVSKKISTALLPLHIAWYNLLKSNIKLHEAILYFEPIDLQEVYLFFKRLGYRYNPKDIKRFFDSRSIIFRYDVTKSGQSAGTKRQRHVRRKRQQIKQ